MNCPTCSKSLVSKDVAGITLDVCQNGCGGIWFDQFEFKKFDEKKEPDAEATLALKTRAGSKSASSEQHNCPKCQTVKMMRHFSSTKRQVLIDQCPLCAGVWLDVGELTQIRNEFENEEQRRKAAEALFDEMAGQISKKEKVPNQTRNFKNALDFIAPLLQSSKKK